MGSVKTALRCGGYSLHKLLVKPSLYMVLAIMFLLIESHTLSLYAFTHDYALSMNAWGLFAMVLSGAYDAALVGIGVIVLFADAPFYDGIQQGILCRVGQKKWLIGQILYVLVGTVIYLVLLFIIQTLLMLPYVTFDNDWGDALSTIVYTTTAQDYNLQLAFPSILMEEFTPLAAFGLTVVLRISVMVTCVLVMFIVNTASRTKFGAVAATFILLLDMTDFLPRAIRALSISSLARLSMLDFGYGTDYPSLPYAVCVLSGCLIVAMAAVIGIGRRFDVADLANRE